MQRNIIYKRFGIKAHHQWFFEREYSGYPNYQIYDKCSCRNVFRAGIPQKLAQYIPSLNFSDLLRFQLSKQANSGILSSTYKHSNNHG